MLKMLKTVASVVAAGMLFTGCETTKKGRIEVDTKPAKSAESIAKNKIVTNGDMAVVIIRLLKMEAMVNIKDRQACIKELQRTGYWPKGQFSIKGYFRPTTLNGMNNLLAARHLESVARDATLERASEVTIKIYDIGTEDNKEMVVETKVSKNGDVTLPLVKRVHIAGLTPADAAEKIRKTYIDKGIYKDLTVDVVGKAGDLFISGEVNEPGRREFEGGRTLCEFIVDCGGLTEFASRDDIRITRNRKNFYYDYDKISENEQEDPVLKPGDRVFVRRRVF